MRQYVYIFVIFLGLLQSIGYIFKIKPVRSMAAAMGVSPLPIVFTEVKGVETFASNFYIQYTHDSKEVEIPIAPALYAKLKGPYNRRNIYGAGIAYGPILDKKLLDSVMNYAFCKKILVNELGIPAEATNFSIKIKTRTQGRNNQWILTPICSI